MQRGNTPSCAIRPRAQDASQLGHMHKRLSASQVAFYRQLVKHFPIGMAVLQLRDPERPVTWTLVASNAKAGLAAGPTIGDFLELRVLGDSGASPSAKLQDRCRQTLTQTRPSALGHIRTETRLEQAGWLLITASPLSSNCIGVFFQDESQLSRAIREREELERQLTLMCDTARAILWRADPETLEFTYVNPQAEDVLGYWIERWCKESNFWQSHTHRDDWELVKARCREAASSGVKTQFDCRMISTRASFRWFRVYVKRVERPGAPAELNGVMVDVTDQKEAEHAARELSARVMRAQEQERKRISRELHDSIGQYLTAVNFTLGSLQDRESLDAETERKLKECAELVRTCMKEIRSVSYMLHPPLVDLLGLAPALRNYGERFSQRTGIRLDLDLAEEMQRLAPDTEIAFFRVAQECLTNVEKHSETKSARLRLARENGHMVLEVEDYGVGVAPGLLERLERGTTAGGIGLLKMRERVHELRGKFQVTSNGKGMKVRAEIPHGEGGAALGDEPALERGRSRASEARRV